MSKLLIDDKPVMVLPKLAQEIGLNEAIVLQQIHYWLMTFMEAKKEDHHIDDRWWVYNTKQEWKENFPWWSENTVWRALRSLRESELVITTSKYNKKGYDRTLWYTINYKKLEALDKSVYPNWVNGYTQNGKMDLPKMGTPIPEITTETTPENTKQDIVKDTRNKKPKKLAVKNENGELAPLEDRIIEIFCDRAMIGPYDRPYENSPQHKKWYSDWLRDASMLVNLDVRQVEMEEAIALLKACGYSCKRPGALIGTIENIRRDKAKFENGEKYKLHRYKLVRYEGAREGEYQYSPVDWWEEKEKVT